MTRRRWIADEVSGNRAALTGAHAEHLSRVLRAHIGQEVDIIATGTLHRGRITTVEDHRVEFELGEELTAAEVANLTLLMSIFKFDRMEWAIEKCTELGASRIVPVIARRTETHLAAAASKRVERWRRVARQAAEQSRRPRPLEICTPAKLKEVLTLSAATRIVLNESEEAVMLKDLLASPVEEGEIALALGPEGGWTEDELQQFHSAGWKSASLGNTILRAETAAIAATAVAISTLQ